MSFTPDRRDLDADDPRPDDPVAAAVARSARYSRWDGSQAAPDLGADELLDALTEDLLEDGDLDQALRRLMERGMRGDGPGRSDLTGLRDLQIGRAHV